MHNSSRATAQWENKENMSRHNLAGLARRGIFMLVNTLSPTARAQSKAFDALRVRFYQQFWQFSADHIGAELQALSDNWRMVKKNGDCTFLQGERVMLDSAVTLELAGNKALIYQLLNEDGYQVPQSHLFSLDTIDEAYKFQKEIQGDVVIKPMASWAGQGVTVNIKTPEALKKASSYASRFGDKLLIEKHIQGDSYRLLFLNGELIDAVRRDPPQVKGDGKYTIKQLIDRENQLRLKGSEIIALSAIVIDIDCKRTLKEQQLSLGHIPANGETIAIKKVVNHNNRYENHVVKHLVHQDIVSLGHKICLQYGIELAGLDIITTDINRPLSETGGVINEINTTPGLHHHSLVSDHSMITPVGSLVLDYILKHHPITR
jgi:cyanophycin synthetase